MTPSAVLHADDGSGAIAALTPDARLALEPGDIAPLLRLRIDCIDHVPYGGDEPSWYLRSPSHRYVVFHHHGISIYIACRRPEGSS